MRLDVMPLGPTWEVPWKWIRFDWSPARELVLFERTQRTLFRIGSDTTELCALSMKEKRITPLIIGHAVSMIRFGGQRVKT